jgi:hypothetical protein
MRLLRPFVACLLLLVAAGLSSAMGQPLPRSILVLNPSDARGPFYYQIFAALRTSVNATAGSPVTLFAENLDLSRFGGAEYETSLENHLRVKYRDKPVGVLVAVGPAIAATFAMFCSVAFWLGEMSLFVSGASTTNPTRTIFTLLLPMKISPRCMLFASVQQVSRPQLVIALFTPGSLTPKSTVWS